MIRELAENPNAHVPLSGGRELVLDPGGRFALYLHPGAGVHDATVQRVRCGTDAVRAVVEEVRALLLARRRPGAEWELGESTEPADLVERLLALGLRRAEHEPVATGMALRGAPDWDVPAGVVARRVASVEELVAARAVQTEAFGGDRELDVAQAERDFAREGVDGSTFVALLDGEIVAAAHASYTPWGLVLFGGATVERARGRGAYRALVAARAREATERGTPVLVVHAGRMSRPILQRLGFEPVARIDRLVDVLG